MAGSGIDDWALERESELARLEYENYELRRMLGILPPQSPRLEPLAFPTRWEAMFEGEQQQQQQQQQQQGTFGAFVRGPPISDMTDDLNLRRQFPQGPTQISLEAASQPHTQTQPLHISFPPDTPLVARRYGRRTNSGSGNFISGGMGGSGSAGSDVSGLNPTPGPFGTFRPLAGSGVVWQDSPIAGPGERNMNLQVPGEDPDSGLPGRDGDAGESQQGPSDWEGLTAMYLRGVVRRPPPHQT